MTWNLHTGDALTVLRTLPAESVHCCVTSPPYWGLRDYGVAGQLGLEATPQEYIARMVEVFGEVRRVLRKDGTLWLNIGDSYANDGKWGGETGGKHAKGLHGEPVGRAKRCTGMKPKDLCGIPWRLAFALQADGWWLRQDIIWHKPNPMPESVRDRCTKAHEYVFLLAKSERYYFDAEAVAEGVTDSTLERLGQPTLGQQAGSDRVPGKTNGRMKAVPPRFGGSKYGDSDAPEHQTKSGNEYTLPKRAKDDAAAARNPNSRPHSLSEFEASHGRQYPRRNKRSVWTVCTQPFPEAHFATFPEALVEPCVLAGCPKGGTVLDPFAGAGTTGLVAAKLGRAFVGIELNPEYVVMAERRCKGPLFVEQ